jgi:hypothetical protein
VQRRSMGSVLGRGAVGAVVVSAAVVPLGIGTAQAETGTAESATVGTAAVGTSWSVDTRAPGGLYGSPDGSYYTYVPAGICSIDWTVTGGQGGAGSDGDVGETGGELRVTTRVTAGQQLLVRPGLPGLDWTAGAAGGVGDGDVRGGFGSPDGRGGGGGGGGAGSSLYSAGFGRIVARGGDGGGDTGGAGGSLRATTTGNTVDGVGDAVETVFDGAASDATGSGHSGAGRVTGAGVGCPAVVPGAPRWLNVSGTREVGVLNLSFLAGVAPSTEVWSPVTGWEVTLDGGSTWSALAVTEEPYGRRLATLRGLANTEHRIAVRATSDLGLGAPSAISVFRLVGVPTGITATAGVSSIRVSWTPPEGGVSDGYVAESYDAAQYGEGTPSEMCSSTADVYTCVLAAEPGRSYRVVVGGGGGRSAAPVTSGVVAAPPVPPSVPASSDVLPAAFSGELAAGSVLALHGYGYLPRSMVSVVVYSAPVVLTSVEVDGTGSFFTDVTLPADLPAGEHTLVATGVDPDGATRTLTRAFTVAAPAAAPATVVPVAAVPAPPVPAAAVPASGGLAYTGAYVGAMAIGGAGVLVLGVVLVFLGRRRRTVPRD